VNGQGWLVSRVGEGKDHQGNEVFNHDFEILQMDMKILGNRH